MKVTKYKRQNKTRDKKPKKIEPKKSHVGQQKRAESTLKNDIEDFFHRSKQLLSNVKEFEDNSVEDRNVHAMLKTLKKNAEQVTFTVEMFNRDFNRYIQSRDFSKSAEERRRRQKESQEKRRDAQNKRRQRRNTKSSPIFARQ